MLESTTKHCVTIPALAISTISFVLTPWLAITYPSPAIFPSMSVTTVKVPFVEPDTATVPFTEMCSLDCSDQTTWSDVIASSAPTCERNPEIVLFPNTSASFSIRSGTYCWAHVLSVVPVKSK